MQAVAAFQPMFGRVLVRPDEVPETTGRIIRPDRAKERSLSGVVVAADTTGRPWTIGSRVLFSSYAGNRFALNGEGCLLLEPEEILVLVEDDPR